MSRNRSDLDDLPDDEDDLYALRTEVQALFEAAKVRDLQAAMGALRWRSRIEAKLVRVMKAADPGAEDLTDEELVAQLVALAERMPDPHLRAMVDIYLSRRGFRLVPVEE